MQATTTKRLCARGDSCAGFPQLGQPAKLSTHNKGAICFKCEEHKVDAELPSPTPTPEPKRKRGSSAPKSRRPKETRPKQPRAPKMPAKPRGKVATCARQSCNRPPAVQSGYLKGRVCREHW